MAAQRYTSPLRAEQAAATRRRIVDAAGRLFAEEGYARTTLTRIAASAGVSVETVQAQGPKRSLLTAAVSVTTFGREGDEQFISAPEGRALLAAADLQEFIRRGARLIREFNERTYRMWRAFGAAAADDADVDAEWSQRMAYIRGNIAEVVGVLDGRGWLRTDVARDELATGLWILSTGEVFEKLVVRVGWSPDHYEDWLARSMGDLLLPR
ncbi:TetR/AcrR family transcriptional regulator [Microlunatus ginsengisoli]|uniref:Helix-turn-helix domain-containing protein n=1 Tax=Microlunatus ginsengisoli TaxID=363863 RepID=A0ABP6ZLW7_9ACTN